MADEYSVQLDASGVGARLTGILRLASPVAYVPVMAPLLAAIEAKPASFRLDIAGLTFMNSSGVTALSRLIMGARKHDVPLVCVVDDTVPWQRKTLSSLQRLYPKLELRAA